METKEKNKDPFAKREALKYKHPIPSREFVLDMLSQRGGALSRSQLIHLFHLDSEFEEEALRRRLRAMVRDGQLFKKRNGKYGANQPRELMTGKVAGSKEGYGFVFPEDGTRRIYISAKEMRQVFDGDLVTVRIIGIDAENRREGSIVKILERGFQQIIGYFYEEGGLGFVKPNNTRITQEIIVAREHQKDAKVGQIVITEVLSYPTMHTQAIGRIIQILGDKFSSGIEISVATYTYGLPNKWEPSVLAQVNRLPEKVLEKEFKDRVDLRLLPLVTIDGEDARDFDDAVYCEPRKRAGWRLVVAIADVSHYVKPGTPLDQAAQERGTSVYFPGQVIPMLPEKLSNQLCSLVSHADRLCMVCDMSLTEEGEVSRYRFYPAVIQSRARLTYNQASEWLSNPTDELSAKEKKLLPHLQNLEKLFSLLNTRRVERGALDFDFPEIKIQFNSERKIKKLVQVNRTISHKIIEECMLCANVCAAHYLEKNKHLGLYRVHDGPSAEKLADLRLFLGELGLTLGGGELPTALDYAHLLKRVELRPDKQMIQTILLRSLQQAYYSPHNEGHFGLAFEAYTHFTSPIRRYPDLAVHRTIKSILKQDSFNYKAPDEAELEILGQHCSMTERRADEATREVISLYKCEYMFDKVGEVFDGVITGVTHFGIFVALKDLYIEGLVHVTDLSDDYYQYDSIRHLLRGGRTGKVYRLGNAVRVKVVRVNHEEKQIDFVLA